MKYFLYKILYEAKLFPNWNFLLSFILFLGAFAPVIFYLPTNLDDIFSIFDKNIQRLNTMFLFLIKNLQLIFFSFWTFWPQLQRTSLAIIQFWEEFPSGSLDCNRLEDCSENPESLWKCWILISWIYGSELTNSIHHAWSISRAKRLWTSLRERKLKGNSWVAIFGLPLKKRGIEEFCHL